MGKQPRTSAKCETGVPYANKPDTVKEHVDHRPKPTKESTCGPPNFYYANPRNDPTDGPQDEVANFSPGPPACISEIRHDPRRAVSDNKSVYAVTDSDRHPSRNPLVVEPLALVARADYPLVDAHVLMPKRVELIVAG